MVLPRDHTANHFSMFLAKKILYLSGSKTRIMNYRVLFSLVYFCVLLTACDDEPEIISIVGKWQGTKAEAELLAFGVPIPVKETDDTFHAEAEFRDDGTVTVTQDAQTSSGMWHQDGDKLMLTITFNTDFIDLSGTYTIKELTSTKLVLFIEKDGTYTDPGSGLDIDGTVKATLYFDKK